MPHENEKKLAAQASMQFVQDGQIVGLGSGTTAAYAIRLLGERVQSGLKIRAVPTSIRTRDLAKELRIPIATLDECPEIDLAIDGADEIDPQLRLIKGGGGAFLREKIVAAASRRFVVIADFSKQVDALGHFPVPVEIVPFAQTVVTRRMRAMGAAVTLRQYSFGNAFVSDEGHQILDCHFERFPDPEALARELDSMPGVVEHGLFLGMADVALIGKGDTVVELKRS
jgi:ribose 5-phosphate isomerase A